MEIGPWRSFHGDVDDKIGDGHDDDHGRADDITSNPTGLDRLPVKAKPVVVVQWVRSVPVAVIPSISAADLAAITPPASGAAGGRAAAEAQLSAAGLRRERTQAECLRSQPFPMR